MVKEDRSMAILVHFKDNHYRYVANGDLNELIDTGSIMGFRRSDGWVEIGRDPVRKKGKPGGRGSIPEKRGGIQLKSCLTCHDFVDSTCRSSKCLVRGGYQGKLSKGF